LPIVADNSPASKAGLKVNDVVLEINNQPVTGQGTVIAVVRDSAPGDDVTIKINAQWSRSHHHRHVGRSPEKLRRPRPGTSRGTSHSRRSTRVVARHSLGACKILTRISAHVARSV